MPARNDWAAVFDVDGTLLPKKAGALWKVVDDHALPEEANAEMIELRERFTPMAVGGNLPERIQMLWLRKTFDIYVKHRLTRQAWQTAIDAVMPREGAVDALLEIVQAGIPFGAISYGCADFIEYLFQRHGVRFDAVYAGRLVHDGDVVVGYDLASLVIPAHKGERSRHFADIHEVPHEKLIGVGDTGGDQLLGHLKEHRIGIVETEKQHEELRKIDAMGEIHVTETFHPVLASIKKRIGLP